MNSDSAADNVRKKFVGPRNLGGKFSHRTVHRYTITILDDMPLTGRAEHLFSRIMKFYGVLRCKNLPLRNLNVNFRLVCSYILH